MLVATHVQLGYIYAASARGKRQSHHEEHASRKYKHVGNI